LKVVVTNSVAMNGGDAAILHGLETILRDALGPGLDLSVHDDAPSGAARVVPFDVRPQLQSVARRARLRLPRRRPRMDTPDGHALLERYASADLVVSSGGTYLTDNYDLTPRIREFELVNALGRPLVLFTQSIGPLWRAATRRALRRTISRARLVLVRDERSRDELHAAGVNGPPTALAADAAFSLAGPDVLAAASEPRPPAEQPRVAVSVRAWTHFPDGDGELRFERYLEAMAGLARHLVERRGARVTFVSTCQGVPEYPHDDSVVADAIATRLPGSVLGHVCVDRDHRDPRALMARLGEFDLVVATRMHAAILSWAGGTPVLPIAYERKTADLAETLGIAEFAHDMGRASTRALCATADELLAEPPALRPALFGAVERQRASALASGELVRQALAA
jgi:colanic acid/amylovoran biosynthesis protein